MPYLTARLDAWLLHRLSGTAVLALLPGGTATGQASIFNGTRPEQGGVLPTMFVSFHQAGAVVDNCLPAHKQGVTAQYLTQVWRPDTQLSAMTTLLDAIEGAFVAGDTFVDEVYQSYRFSVLSQDAEPQQIGVSQGILYASAGYRWRIAAEAAI